MKLIKNRNLIQGLTTLLSNIQIGNFFSGKIYSGNAKALCVPGLNCYSCPGAIGSCPIGAFQAVVGSSKFSFSYYITGLAIFFGVMGGRLVCGFLCPFGWFQDLLYKIKSKKKSTKKLKKLRYIKYLVLFGVVFLANALVVNKFGQASPYFCKLLCPQGILQGALPLAAANPGLISAFGLLFLLKMTILVGTIYLSIKYFRPFCKWLCPLGAFYSFFNKVSFYKYHFDENSCISCGRCIRACKMDVDMTKCQDHLECIRCGDCLKICPANAISTSITKKK